MRRTRQIIPQAEPILCGMALSVKLASAHLYRAGKLLSRSGIFLDDADEKKLSRRTMLRLREDRAPSGY
jgi:hypothetical protein